MELEMHENSRLVECLSGTVPYTHCPDLETVVGGQPVPSKTVLKESSES